MCQIPAFGPQTPTQLFSMTSGSDSIAIYQSSCPELHANALHVSSWSFKYDYKRSFMREATVLRLPYTLPWKMRSVRQLPGTRV